MPPLKAQCFVVMPFGKKQDPQRADRASIDFDDIYRRAIKPAIEAAGMVAIRADEETTQGTIHKPMFERLLLSDYVVADLTIPNPNVFYELGIRHAARHNSTLPIFASHVQLPFDVALLRALPYTLPDDNRLGEAEAEALETDLTKRLKTLREAARTSDAQDSPVYQLLSRGQTSNLPASAALRRIRETDGSLFELLNRYSGHAKTDIFRDVVVYAEHRKTELAAARALPQKEAVVELNRIREDVRPFDHTEAGVLVDLLLSYRAISKWDEMIALYDELPDVLTRTVLVREQLAFALNRRAPREPRKPEYRTRAVDTLKGVIQQVGNNPESCGVLGRVYKDLWQESLAAGRPLEARGHLRQAIDAYLAGFRADWRDAYPGVNAVTLLDIDGSAKSLQLKAQLLPVVRFAVQRRIDAGTPDYWDFATLLELAVLDSDEDGAAVALADALAHVREAFEPETTAKNLTYIADAREARQNATPWLTDIVRALTDKHRAVQG